MSEPAIKEAMEAEKIFMSDPDAYLRYVNRQMALMDYRSGLEDATQEGIAQGIAQGRREGRAEGRQLGIAHIAMNMLRAGTPIATVAQMAEEHGVEVSQ